MWMEVISEGKRGRMIIGKENFRGSHGGMGGEEVQRIHEG